MEYILFYCNEEMRRWQTVTLQTFANYLILSIRSIIDQWQQLCVFRYPRTYAAT